MNSTYELATRIMNTFDWTWYLSDSSYDKKKREAEAQMRYFVQTISTLDTQTRRQLRAQWIAKYEETQRSVSQSMFGR